LSFLSLLFQLSQQPGSLILPIIYLEKMSSDNSTPQFAVKDGYPKDEEKVALEREDSIQDPSIGEGIDLLGQQIVDPALTAKMHIVNNVRKHSHKRLSFSGIGNFEETLGALSSVEPMCRRRLTLQILRSCPMAPNVSRRLLRPPKHPVLIPMRPMTFTDTHRAPDN
jgi:hypothetical protein